MTRHACLALLLLTPLLASGCSSERQIRYGGRGLSQGDAYEAALQAFDDCGLAPRGNKAEITIESHWDWVGIGPAAGILLFPLSWAQYKVRVHQETIDLEGNAYGLNWLWIWMNLPVGFPIGDVEDRIKARLDDAKGGARPSGR